MALVRPKLIWIPKSWQREREKKLSSHRLISNTFFLQIKAHPLSFSSLCSKQVSEWVALSHSLSYFSIHLHLKMQPLHFHFLEPFFLFNPIHSVWCNASVVFFFLPLWLCRSDPCGDTEKIKDFDFWVLFFGALGHWKSGEIVVGVMGSNGSKATSSSFGSSSSSSSSSGSLRKGRSKGLKVFQSCCLGTTSGSHDSDNEDQVILLFFLFLVFAMLLFSFVPSMFSFFACVSSPFTYFKLLTDMLWGYLYIWIAKRRLHLESYSKGCRSYLLSGSVQCQMN